MRVLVVHNHYRANAPSGERTVIEQETEGLRSYGHEVRLFERFSDEVDTWHPARRAAVPLDALWGFSSRRPLSAVLRDYAPEVVHVHNLFPLVSPRLLTACAEVGIPVVATIHNYRLLCARGDFYRAGSTCLECSDGSSAAALRHRCFHDSTAQTATVVAGTRLHRRAWQRLVSAYVFISDAERSQLQAAGLPGHRSFVKWNFVSEGSAAEGPPADQVAYVGRLEQAKGVDILMRAWERFRAESPGSTLRLAVVGGGPMAQEVATWAEGQTFVDYHGLMERDEAMQVMGRSRCVLLPSQWMETFGLVAVEAMSRGVPPVAAASGAFPELIDDGRTGLLVAPTDVGGWARAIGAVDRERARFDAMGAAARRLYRERFSADRNLEQLIDIYRFAIQNPVQPSTHRRRG